MYWLWVLRGKTKFFFQKILNQWIIVWMEVNTICWTTENEILQNLILDRRSSNFLFSLLFSFYFEFNSPFGRLIIPLNISVGILVADLWGCNLNSGFSNVPVTWQWVTTKPPFLPPVKNSPSPGTNLTTLSNICNGMAVISASTFPSGSFAFPGGWTDCFGKSYPERRVISSNAKNSFFLQKRLWLLLLPWATKYNTSESLNLSADIAPAPSPAW